MYVILNYDVSARRDPAVLKICRRYLRHIQRSVFEGSITEAKLRTLKWELRKKVVPSEDAICIFKLGSLKFMEKEEIGLVKNFTNII